MEKFDISVAKQNLGKNRVRDGKKFWKLKHVLVPTSLGIPHAIVDAHDNLITDPFNIDDEYRNEFPHRSRKREICDDLSWYESFQNNLCILQIYVSKTLQSVLK